MWLLLLLLYIILYNTDPVIIKTLDIPQDGTPPIIWGFKVTEDDVHCLALNIYFESRGEPELGQYAVADVVVNRVKNVNFPDTICDVVFFGLTHPRTGQMYSCAFSWTCDNVQYSDPQDKEAFKQAIKITNKVLFDPYYEMVVPTATHFHSGSPERIWWTYRKHQIAQIGNHYFYD